MSTNVYKCVENKNGIASTVRNIGNELGETMKDVESLSSEFMELEYKIDNDLMQIDTDIKALEETTKSLSIKEQEEISSYIFDMKMSILNVYHRYNNRFLYQLKLIGIIGGLLLGGNMGLLIAILIQVF